MKRIIDFSLFVILLSGLAGSRADAQTLNYIDGLDHSFDGDADAVNVGDSPSSQPTRLVLGPNANIVSRSLGQTAGRVFGNSILEVNGSLLRSTSNFANAVWGEDHSKISIVGATLISQGNGNGLYLSDDAQGIVEDSSISASDFHGITVTDRAQLAILSGEIGSTGFHRTTLQVSGQAVVDIYGGIFTEGPFSVAGFEISAAGQIHLYGHSFTLDGLPSPAGPVALGPFAGGVVKGTLSNGDQLDTTYYVFQEKAAAITFHIVPEPAALLLLTMPVVLVTKRHGSPVRA